MTRPLTIWVSFSLLALTVALAGADCVPGFSLSGAVFDTKDTSWEDPDNPGHGAPDADWDAIPDKYDNCPYDPNPDQADSNGDGMGDACTANQPAEPDYDGDGIPDADDNCPYDYNPEQADADGNGMGDTCTKNQPPEPDWDGDKIPDSQDNCPYNYNPDQADADGNGMGDACGAPAR